MQNNPSYHFDFNDKVWIVGKKTKVRINSPKTVEKLRKACIEDNYQEYHKVLNNVKVKLERKGIVV